jgi:hypothetical protein
MMPADPRALRASGMLSIRLQAEGCRSAKRGDGRVFRIAAMEPESNSAIIMFEP